METHRHAPNKKMRKMILEIFLMGIIIRLFTFLPIDVWSFFMTTLYFWIAIPGSTDIAFATERFSPAVGARESSRKHYL
jgi:hypothetical protein